ncbi:LptF/LptG family permease [Sinomicrobium weinanense]|uniref:LptF/LptG family permease n=1 Tax=Sinomicrobium weinanense TaxID=2842200 RepID=A0A926JP92_9FLAO|nr:LptF/LptG family permease [Sinomicrobium weinanense]MBC9794804.1 LptF/LptG family permease [Sinomicrobium weinanense]MBU3125063.1 LptF/LptG family permease [Sinomicrobium weinanense]
MKILDRYILSRFLINFISSFGILMIIFIFQAIWLFIDDLAGKGLDLWVIGKFLLYYSPSLVPTVLPFTVLLASLMTFGSFAENYEFAAMKSSGISLYRAMRSLIVFMIALGGFTFYFANSVIPRAEFKAYNLKKNIAKVKPAMAISEGMFNDIQEMNIKVEKKHGDNDRLLDNVILHKKDSRGENKTVIKAKKGELISNEKSDILKLKLMDGYYYEDQKPSNPRNIDNYPHAKAKFEIYTMNVDLSELNDVDFEDESYNTYKMYNVTELDYLIDSIAQNNSTTVRNFSDNIYKRTGITMLNRPLNNNKKEKDTTVTLQKEKTIPLQGVHMLDLLEDRKKGQVIDIALSNITNIVNTINSKKKELQRKDMVLNYYIMAMHSKYALAFACVILFFVGAPLGAIIRKGGIGLPMVVGIVLFLTYHFLGMFARNYAKDASIPPILGSWLSTLIMLPLGIFLTRRATADKGVLNVDSITEPIRKLFGKLKKKDDG